ncbi:MAG: single-stranded DNA-binding protein, partial [Deltaproteobacteria bacterium]|nr:single-stranded DNA-binding protein [Deltaproteobacteria bacterium]
MAGGGVNKVILVGRLGADPEMKYGSSGNPFTTFNLATSETWTKDGQKTEKTEWHRIIAFGKLAEICAQYLNKGKQVYIEGKIQTRNWEDKEGIKR